MSKIRTYEAKFNGEQFIFSDRPYSNGNFPSSGYHSLDGDFQPIEVGAKSDRVFIFTHETLSEREIQKLKVDWEQSEKNI